LLYFMKDSRQMANNALHLTVSRRLSASATSR
jgi:hypothetical protein